MPILAVTMENIRCLGGIIQRRMKGCGSVCVIVLTKRNKALFVTLVLTTLLFGVVKQLGVTGPSNALFTGRPRLGYKAILAPTYERRSPKILLWTKFFGSWNWFEESKDVFRTTCPVGCQLTNNRSELESSDAIVFNLADSVLQGLYINRKDWFNVPNFRRPDQVWVMHNMEPMPMIWGDVSWWNGKINWTWDITMDSDIVSPYGRVRPLNKTEALDADRNFVQEDNFSSKSKRGGMFMASDCTDEARRYRVVDAVGRHIKVDSYGGCGRPCPGDYRSCNDLLEHYQFYLALENSDCRDYVSEKFWRSLERKQIPIVAWKHFSLKRLVPPNSFINVYDFPDLDQAGEYIAKVSVNKSLYNSYFDWKRRYELTHEGPGLCKLCSMLKNSSIHAMTYHNLKGWYEDDICQQVSVPRFLHRVADRVFFDFKSS